MLRSMVCAAAGGALLMSAACTIDPNMGVQTVYRDAADVAGPVAGVPKQASVAPAAAADRKWYARYLRNPDPCNRPFLVVEHPDGSAADIYHDTRCY